MIVDHVDDAPDRGLVELVAALEQVDELLEQAADVFGSVAAGGDLVAANGDDRRRKGGLDLAQMLVAGPSRADIRWVPGTTTVVVVSVVVIRVPSYLVWPPRERAVRTG